MVRHMIGNAGVTTPPGTAGSRYPAFAAIDASGSDMRAPTRLEPTAIATQTPA